MNKSKHTPGPWAVHREEKTGNVPYVVAPDLLTMIADVNTVERHILHAPEDAEANARLIAVAPELLEALEQAAAAYELLIVSTLGFTPEERSAMEKDLALFEAAIHKARGEQC